MQDAATRSVRVSGGAAHLDLTIGGASGCIEQLRCAVDDGDGSSSSNSSSYSLLDEPLQPCFFRACTDNDRGGSGGSSYAGRWVAAGLDRLGVDGESTNQWAAHM